MKALSLKQPYATWVAEGVKTIETRTWSTLYRGKVLICASSSEDKMQRTLIHEHDPVGDFRYPLGVALAVATLFDCRPMLKIDERAACCKIYPRARSWVLKDVRKLQVTYPVKGRLGLFEVDDRVVSVLEGGL